VTALISAESQDYGTKLLQIRIDLKLDASQSTTSCISLQVNVYELEDGWHRLEVIRLLDV